MRDDFNETTKRKLRDRVGGRCSNPACRTPTVGASSSEDGVSNIGVAAHITAAAAGGPRYDASFDSQQRSAFRNGIWLCQNHAAEIDRDEPSYSEDVLRQWKNWAENAARMERGTRLPDARDAVDTVTAALTATSNRFISSAVKNVHTAASSALAAIDERFAVSSSYSNGITVFSVAAKEPVPIKLIFDVAKYPEVKDGLLELFSQGKGFEVAASAVRMEGSPLFDAIAKDCANGKFGLQAPHRQAKIKIYVQSPASNERMYFDDIDAVVSGGSALVKISGEGWGGLVSFALAISMSSSSHELNVEVGIDLTSWEGVGITGLPYFGPLSDFFEHLHEGEALFITVTAQGTEILASKPILIGKTDVVKHAAAVLKYIKNVLAIARLTKAQILFRGGHVISKSDFNTCWEVARIAAGGFRIAKENLRRNPQLTITVGTEAERLLDQTSGDQVVQIRDQETPPISAFGQSISLPLCTTTLAPVRIKRKDNRPLVAGQQVSVEIEMREGSAVTKVFQP